jgi:hypothetical protein
MDTVLGLVELFFYVLAVLALSMALTWLVIKISPSDSAKRQEEAEAKSKA